MAAHDTTKEGVRDIRISRVLKAIVNSSSEGTPDYTVPTTFVLREHAK
jgi:hypothetical protein